MVVRVASPGGRFIDYRLNILGIRVWENSRQLIARSGAEWSTIGTQRDLPVDVPKNAGEPKKAAAESLRLTAYQYCAESPGSDLVGMLNKTADFSAALRAPAEPGDGRRLQ